MQRQRINIAEKRMQGLVGHFADVSRRLTRADQSIQFDVYCASTATPELAAFFASHNAALHPTLERPGLSSLEKLISLPFGRDNYKSWRKKWFPASRASYHPELFDAPLFFPTADVSDVLGVLSRERRHPVLFGFWYSPAIEFAGADDALHRALSSHNTEGLTLGAYDDETFADLKKFSGVVEVLRLPCPYDREISPMPANHGPRVRVGFFGNMRDERGGLLKDEIARQCRQAGMEVVDDSVSKPKRHGAATGYVAALGDSMSTCDIVVWPSDPQAYAQRTSGIVFHCLANGLPAVVPKNCRPEKILNQYSHPHGAFPEHRPDSIVEKIQLLSEKLPQARNQALNSSGAFNAHEGTKPLSTILKAHLFSKKSTA